MNKSLTIGDVRAWIKNHFNVKPSSTPQIVRCDNKLGCYAVALSMAIGPTLADPWFSTLYLVYINKKRQIGFRCILKPSQVINEIIEIKDVRIQNNHFLITFLDKICFHGCWPRASIRFIAKISVEYPDSEKIKIGKGVPDVI